MVVFCAELEHLLDHTAGPQGRYRRQPRNTGPTCKCCGTPYVARSTRPRITYYYPRCQCAPRHGIPKLRPSRFNHGQETSSSSSSR